MAYVIAKNRGTNGCIAIKMKHGTELVELKREMNLQYEGSELHFATISRPSAYGEYAPYHIVDTTDEFKREVSRL